MFKNFWNDVILINLKDYGFISFDFYINIFLFALCVCVCISSFYIEHQRGSMALMLKQLIRHNAFSEESAKSLMELGLLSSLSIKRSLSRETRLSKIVSRVGYKKLSYDEFMALSKEERKKLNAVDFSTAKFYISPESSNEAKHVYETYQTSLVKTLLMCALVFLIYGALCAISSEVLEYIRSLCSK